MYISKNCPFNAIQRNGNRCPAHQRTWYPLRKHRGSYLHGPEFLPPLGKGKKATCDCDHNSCFKAGYFPGQDQDPFYVGKKGLDVIASTPKPLTSNVMDEINSGKK